MTLIERKELAYDIETDTLVIERYIATADRAPITIEEYVEIMRRLRRIVDTARELAN